MKIALLSNVNIQSLAKRLGKNREEVYTPHGYGLVMEELMDPQSELWNKCPNVVFVYIDVWELTFYGHNIDAIHQWFSDFESCLHNDCTYFLFDADWRGGYITGYDTVSKPHLIENQWNSLLNDLCGKYKNCFVFNFKSMVEETGRQNIYSNKTWLLGKIPFSSTGEKVIADEIERMLQLLSTSPKKVLILDLDNTLWGGVIGEDGLAGIELGREGKGAAYYYFQVALKKIKDAGTLLCVVSKNNIEDVQEVFEKHPDMALSLDDFTVILSNWDLKSKNIFELATRLNLSADSFVFVDDNPAERGEVALQIPGIAIPEFPSDVTKLSEFADCLYKDYFAKLKVTSDDLAKSKNYKENFEREEGRKYYANFDDFLDSLNITVELVSNYKEYVSRIHQLIYKTNQFNLTTMRFDLPEIYRMLDDENYLFYLFTVRDRFGDSGQTGLVLVNLSSGTPSIDVFVMSCRIMGRKIENYIIDVVEQDLINKGYKILKARYVYTSKSKPVENFYDGLGYECISANQTEKLYTLDLATRAKREFRVFKEESLDHISKR